MKHYVLGFYVVMDEADISNETDSFQTGAEVLLIEKTKPEWQRGFYTGHGGLVEAGETPYEAMVREFQEETGVKTYPGEWYYVVSITGGHYRMDVFVAITSSLGSYMPKCDEGTNKLFRLTNIPRNMEPTARWLLPLALDATTYGKVFYSRAVLIQAARYVKSNENWVDTLRDKGATEDAVAPYLYSRAGVVEFMRDVLKADYENAFGREGDNPDE